MLGKARNAAITSPDPIAGSAISRSSYSGTASP